jgi:CheY-like chemotaxis protein
MAKVTGGSQSVAPAPGGSQSVAPAPEGSQGGAWRAKGTVIVADDEKPLRTVLSLILEEVGFDVIQVTDGVEALDAARAKRGELAAIVLDVSMPRLGGVEALRAMRQDGLSTPVVLVTGYPDGELSAADLREELAPVALLGKPFGSEELVGTVRAVMGR